MSDSKRMEKTRKEFYSSPEAEVVETAVQQVVCTSGKTLGVGDNQGYEYRNW